MNTTARVDSSPPHGEDRSPTIYDVARAAGVAPSTVSRAFSRPGRVKAETAARIHEIAAGLGYRVSPVERSLPTAGTGLLAVVVSDITNPFFFEIIRGIEEAATAAGLVMLLVDADESASGEREAIDRALPMVDAVVLANTRMSDTAIRMVAKQRPTVVMHRPMTDVPSLVIDEPRGMRRAVEHLAEMGHRAVTYVSGPEASWANGMRWRSVREAAYELELEAHRIGPCPPTLEGGRAAVARFATSPTTAVIAYNDLIAIGFMQALQQRGVRVPHDVSVVGNDNIFGSDFCQPTLTTVAAPRRALGAVATRMAIDAAQAVPRRAVRLPAGPREVLRPVMLPSNLVVRGSTGPRSVRRRAC